MPLDASESPRSALGPAVSVPRYHAVHDRAWRAGSLAQKVVPGNSTTGLVSSRYLGFGVSQIPRRHRQFAFPPIPTGTPSRLTALARLGSLLRSVRPPGTGLELSVERSHGSNSRDQHICALTCASVDDRKSDKTEAVSSCGGARDAGPLVAYSYERAGTESNPNLLIRCHPRLTLGRGGIHARRRRAEGGIGIRCRVGGRAPSPLRLHVVPNGPATCRWLPAGATHVMSSVSMMCRARSRSA